MEQNIFNASNRNKFIVGGVVFVLLINFVLIPMINRQRATSAVQGILKAWIADDYATPLKDFQNPEKSPPIYNLESYKVEKLTMTKIDGEPTAKFSITLNFSDDNVFPSGKVWNFELQQIGRHWMVINYNIL